MPKAPIRYPDFICIGAQKSGTTWLYENLKKHPDVWMSPIKEVQYFNELYIPDHHQWIGEHRRVHAANAMRALLSGKSDSEIDFGGVEQICRIVTHPVDDHWYGSIFGQAPADRICGEITPEYSLLPSAGIAHLRRLSPSARIIFMMRDPIERTISHLRMLKAKDPSLSFETAMTFRDVHMRSDYATIIGNWRKAFGPDQMFLACYDEIKTDPIGLLQRLCGFLGIRSQRELFEASDNVVFAGPSVEVPEEVYSCLRAQYGQAYRNLLNLGVARANEWHATHYSQAAQVEQPA